MDGGDLMDQNIWTYSISIHTYWWTLFAYLLDVVMHNAWQIYRLTKSLSRQPIDLLEFQRSVYNMYCKT